MAGLGPARPRLVRCRAGWVLVAPLLGLGLVLWLGLAGGLGLAHVAGASMHPTLRDGQRVLLRPAWLGAAPQRGALVVFSAPPGLAPKRYLKRLVALPGERVSLRADGLYLNGSRQEEAYAGPAPRPDTFPDVVVSQGQVIALEGYALSELPAYLQPTLAQLEPLPPAVLRQSFQQPVSFVATLRLAPGTYFVMGDNRVYNASEDSRWFGPVTRQQFVALAFPL